jgi:hypothetical protein
MACYGDSFTFIAVRMEQHNSSTKHTETAQVEGIHIMEQNVDLTVEYGQDIRGNITPRRRWSGIPSARSVP